VKKIKSHLTSVGVNLMVIR